VTEQESREVYQLARALFPKDKPEMTAAMIDAVDKFHPAQVKAALKSRLEEEEFISVSDIIVRITRAGEPQAPLRWRGQAEVADAKRARIEAEKKAIDRHHEKVAAYCQSLPPEELERRRQAVLARMGGFVPRGVKDKPTLESPALMGMIYAEFVKGREGVEV
jgi:hypothetical protein